MKKIPYGISDFKRIQTENYYFIDKTPYILILRFDFSALDINKENNFKSLLFYLGLISIKNREFDLNLHIPNETVKRIDIEFLKDSLEREQLFSIELSTLERKFKAFALQGKVGLFKYLAKKIQENTGIRDYIYNEQTIKSMYLAYLSLTPYYVIKSEE